MIDAGTIKECADDLTISTAAPRPLYEPSPDVENRDSAPEVETPEIMESPEVPDKTPFFNFAYVFAFFIILFALPLLFFHNPVYEMFFGLRGQKNEIALTNGIMKIVPGLPDDIINSREDSEAVLMDKPLLGKPPGDKSREDVVVTRARPIRKPADLETAEIPRPEGSRDQLKGAKISEEKFLVYFRKDSTELDSRLFETLTKIVDLLPLHPDAKIFIEGYTDSYGNYFYNKKISQLRANIVKSYFEGQGIAESRITAIGMGPENPVADNTTREGRSKNRRVEIRLAQ